jgi:hypothetical protein
VSRTIWRYGRAVSGDGFAAFTIEDPIRLRREVGSPLFLAASQDFTEVQDEERPGQWRVRTLRYSYALCRTPDLAEEVVLWHWHPPISTEPHIHVGGTLHKLHIPSGRVSFEAVLRFLIQDMGVRRERPEWEELLADAEGRFRAYRSWS